jgi:hypothetical protein
VPTVEQDGLPFDVLEILARTQERVEAVLARWRTRDQELEAELGNLEQRAEAAEARLTEVEAQADAARHDHERRAADEGDRLARLQGKLEDGSAQIAAEPEQAGPDEPEAVAPIPISGGTTTRPTPVPARSGAADASWRGLGPFVYWPLIGLIVLAEIPLNAFAFRLFRESDLFTYVLTISVAVGLVMCAHAVGLFLAHPSRTRVEDVLVIAFVAIPSAAIVVISFVRYGYLVEVGDFGMGPLVGTLAFALINLLVFGAAVVWSYLRHDPRTLVNRRAAIRQAERESARAERRNGKRERELLERERRRRDEERRRELQEQAERREAELEGRRREGQLRRDEIDADMRAIREAARERLDRLAELDAQVEAARVALGEAQRAVQASAAERRALLETAQAELRSLSAHRERLFFRYASANVRARAGHATPACLRAVPPLELPEAFRAPTVEVA